VSETAHAPPPAAVAPRTFLQRHHFLLRRLHSLSGIVPVGLFVVMHLFTNFQIMTGDYQHEVEFIHALPALLTLEIAIWVGIGFHAVLGLYYTFSDKADFGVTESAHYKYKDSWRYTLQRITGILALIFILLHVATLRWRWSFGGWFTPFFVASPADGQPLVAATTAAALQGSVLVLVLYIVGIASVVYHWCNGLWTAAISWGLTLSVASMRRWGYFCAALGVVLTIFSAGAIIGSLRYDITPAQREGIKAAIEAYKEKGQVLDRASEHVIEAPRDPRLHLDPGISPSAPAEPHTPDLGNDE
jgi:succinate dehydrogenase / fumarate reductase cytochrome b subunit